MSLASLFVKVGADVNGFEKGMKQVRSDIDQTAKKASFFSDTLSTAIGTGTALAVNKGISSLTNFVKFIQKTGEDFNSLKENSTLAFETMLGSVDQAKSFLVDLQKFAEKTPFELPGLIDASQKMIAFGFTAQSVIPTLTSIGDAVAGLGGSPEKLQRVITAIGQIKAKGKVQAQEMLQLAEAGIPAWDMLAKAIGKSIPEAMKETEKGAVGAGVAIDALVKGMNAKFGGLMAKQSKTFTGLKSTFNDLLRDVAARVTKPWFDNAKKGLERMVAIMQSDKFQQFVSKATSVSEKAANLVANVKHNIIDFVGKGFNFFHSFFGSGNDAKKSFSILDILPKKIKALIGYIKPVGDFIYNIADKGFRAFTGIFDDFYRSFNKISNQRFYFFGDMSLEQFSTGIKSIFNDIRNGGKNLNYWLYTAPKAFQMVARVMLASQKIFTYFSGDGLQATLKKLWAILSGLGATLSKLVRPFKEALGSLFQQLSTMKNLGFADIFKAVLNSIGQAFMGFLKVIKDEFWPTIKGALVWVWNSLTSFITSIDWVSVWSGVVGVFSSLYDTVTGIDWSSVWDTITAGVSSVADYIASFDWASLWALIGSGLSTLNQFFKDYVFPALGDFVAWLVSWFTDSSKNNLLFTAIKATWNFISDWASYIWQGVEPYLSSFFSWLSSWFTDPAKRQQLVSAIISTWNFISNWASYIWSSVSPYLSSFFGSLFSWFTDASKRSQLWAGITTTWDFVTKWAGNLWNWVSPYLAQFWGWLTGWVTDPAKRTSLYNGIVTTWSGFVDWASGLWLSMYPWFESTGTNLDTWVATNKPEFTPWYESIKAFLIPTQENWSDNWKKMRDSVKDLFTTLKTEVPKIGQAINEMYQAMFGDSPQTTWLDYVAYAVENFTYKIRMIVTQVRIVLDMINLINDGWSHLFSGDFQGFAAMSSKWNDLLNQFIAVNQTPAPQLPGYAIGGIAQGGRALVGEKGPEVVDLPRGTRVWDHGQSMGKLNNASSQTVTIVLKNDGTLPTDRRSIDEIALQLQRRLSLQGNRLVFA